MTVYVDKQGLPIDTKTWRDIVDPEGTTIAHDHVGGLSVLTVWDGEGKYAGDEIFGVYVDGRDVRGHKLSTFHDFAHQSEAMDFHRQAVARLRVIADAVDAGITPFLAEGAL
ncbi:hypothetical protein [Arthrobacter alpinus]|uniref:hypothetical protein n=1 Tax=Arthrobacter alpinus TaxID=656366 RepID=UPI001114E2C4|nr:hypothetical protein [Arthrobacter alpinus]